jgi:hypothetical protein
MGVVWTVAYLEAKSKAHVALEVFRDPCGRRRRSRRQRGGGSVSRCTTRPTAIVRIAARTVAQLRRLPQGLVSNFEISAHHTTLEQSSDGDLLIVFTLRVGMPSGTLCVQNDAERHALRYHAERWNDHAEIVRTTPIATWQAERRRRSVGPPPTGHPWPNGGSRGSHAARPTPRHLRSACTQVAMGVVWTVAYLEAKSKANAALEVFRDPCGRRRRSRRQRGGGSVSR